jgi:hypothetical protein
LSKVESVSELQHFPETSYSSVSMAGGCGRGGRRGQVPNEEAPHRDRSVQDVVKYFFMLVILFGQC